MTERFTGRELSMAVAERVFGYEVDKRPLNGIQMSKLPDGSYEELRRYSIDMAAAWQVVEHLVKKYPSLTFQLSTVKEKWEAYFSDFDADACIEADEPALAICVAALDIVEAKADALEAEEARTP